MCWVTKMSVMHTCISGEEPGPPSSVLSVGARLGPENVGQKTCYLGIQKQSQKVMFLGLKGWRRIQTFLQERQGKAGKAHTKPCRLSHGFCSEGEPGTFSQALETGERLRKPLSVSLGNPRFDANGSGLLLESLGTVHRCLFLLFCDLEPATVSLGLSLLI